MTSWFDDIGEIKGASKPLHSKEGADKNEEKEEKQ